MKPRTEFHRLLVSRELGKPLARVRVARVAPLRPRYWPGWLPARAGIVSPGFTDHTT